MLQLTGHRYTKGVVVRVLEKDTKRHLLLLYYYCIIIVFQAIFDFVTSFPKILFD
jgi:hypothetical protein